MPLASHWSRASNESHRLVACRRVRPSPRSSKVSVSRATPSGMPSQVKVWTIRSGLTVWKQPRKAVVNSSPREAV